MIARLSLLLALVPCVAAAQAQGQKKTAWAFSGQKGTQQVAAILGATGKYDGDRPLLVVRCMNGEIEPVVHWPRYLGTAPTVAVKWRTNDSTVKAEDWTLLPGGRIVSHPTPIPFLQGLFGKTELIVSATPHGEAEESVTFPIAGVEGAMKWIGDNCKRNPALDGQPKVGWEQPQERRKTGWEPGERNRDGSREVIASVSDISGSTYGRGFRPSLAVRCTKGKTEAAVKWPTYLGTGPTIAVKWRTNDSTEKTESWTREPGGRAVSHPTPIPFLKSLFGKTELTVSVTTRLGAEPSLTFPITGVEDAMKRISDACRWDPAPGPQPKVSAPK